MPRDSTQHEPAVVTDPDDSGALPSSPTEVKAAFRRYFSKLYRQPDPPAQDKPWMSSPFVLEIRHRVQADDFTRPLQYPASKKRPSISLS